METIDWNEALNFLREQLREKRAFSVLQEIDRVTSRRVEVYKDSREIVSSEEIPESKETQKRAQTPKEAFIAAVEVLESWLVELPSIGDKIVENLGDSAESVVWRPDITEEERISEGEEFDVSDFRLSKEAKEEIRESISEIKNIIS
jgi:hypothetical protein